MRILELISGLLLFPAALWAFLYPRRDFELGTKLGFIGIRNRDQLDLNRVGVIRHRLGAACSSSWRWHSSSTRYSS